MRLKIITVLSAGFAVIFMTKLSTLTWAADAKTPRNIPVAGLIETPPPQPGIQPAAQGIAPEKCLTPTLAKAVFEDKDRLRQDRLKLEERVQYLTALEAKLAERLDTVEAANKKLDNKIQSLSTAAQDDIDHLVGMYSAMKPKKAAEIFDKMDPAFSAGFLRQMDSAPAGIILSEMNATTSYRVSLIIATENAKWRSQ